MSKQVIRVPRDEHNPKNIPADTKAITNWLGRYNRGLETDDFIFFINYQEGDENASVMMYRKDGMELASDNYFAYSALFELLDEKENRKKITFMSNKMKYNLRLHDEANK